MDMPATESDHYQILTETVWLLFRVKVRGGLLIEGASAIPNSPWNVLFESGDKDGTAQVTVSVKEDVKYSKSFQ